LLSRKAAEQEEMAKPKRVEVREEERISRISGASDWKEARGESGPRCDSSAASIELLPASHFIKLGEFEETFSFPDFGSAVPGRDVVLVASAQLVKVAEQMTCRLTPASNDQRGAMWRKGAIPVDCSFFSYFTFQIRNGPSADGI